MMEDYPLFIPAPPGLHLIIETDEGPIRRPLIGWGAGNDRISATSYSQWRRQTGWQATVPLFVAEDGTLQSAHRYVSRLDTGGDDD